MTAALGDGLFEVPAGKLAAIVTDLEMRRAPAASPAPRPELRLRHEAMPGIAWYRDLFRRIGEPWLWCSRLQLSETALAARLHDRDTAVHALERDGQDVGLVELDFRMPGACEIVYFGLLPGLTGRGFGAWMMGEALRIAWARPLGRVWLHTCTLDHPAALAFYVRMGFVSTRRRVEILDDPRRDGTWPVETAPQVPLL